MYKDETMENLIFKLDNYEETKYLYHNPYKLKNELIFIYEHKGYDLSLIEKHITNQFINFEKTRQTKFHYALSNGYYYYLELLCSDKPNWKKI